MAIVEKPWLTTSAAVPASAPANGAPVSLEQVRSLLVGLNREQRRAVTHTDGPALVLAGPGTGKTEVLTRRVAWLIATKRSQPRQILALTFTNKAATEMQARVDLLVPYGQADAAIHTFHAFGDRLLREFAYELGLAGDLRLIGRAEAIGLLREQLFSLGLDRYRPLSDPTRFIGALVDFFGRAKDEGIQPAQLADHARQLAARATAETEERDALLDLAQGQAELAHAFERYQQLLDERGLIDHADQVLLALRLLRERPAVRQALRQRHRYVLVDEFQDTNPAQLELLLELAGERANIVAVGDDDQAIYAFRGAAVSNMRRFARSWPNVRRIVLRRNYRSTPQIIEAAQRLIGHNGSSRLAIIDGLNSQPRAQRRSRAAVPVRLRAYRTRDEEADALAEDIDRRLAAGLSPADVAVLVRTNSELVHFARSLAVRGIVVRSTAPSPLGARSEVRALLAFMRVVADPQASQDLYALATASPYGLGGEELTGIVAFARRRHLSLWQLLAQLEQEPTLIRLSAGTRRKLAALQADIRAAVELSHTHSTGEVLYDYLRRSGRLARLVNDSRASNNPTDLQDIARFFQLVRSQGALLADDRVALLAPHLEQLLESMPGPSDEGPGDEQAVALLTVHRAKGLEFPIVYLCGLTDGRFPVRARPPALPLPVELTTREPASDPDELAEERRLCYVAMTRARDELVLSYSLESVGRRGARRPSPFVGEALDITAVELPGPSADLAALADPAAGNRSQPAAGHGRAPANDPLSLSYSQLDDYFGCPERYRLRHVVGVPAPAHHALSYGSALHQAVAAFHLAQAKGEVMGEDELLAALARSWSPEGFLSRAHEEARYATGQSALRRFRAQQLAQGSLPSAIERPFTFKLGQDRLRGRMDRLDSTPEGTVITDYKSSDVREQAKANQKARDSLQLQVYAMAHEAETGRLPHEVRLHFLDSGVVGTAVPEPTRLARAAARIQRAADSIRAGNFEATPSAIACGYCPYKAYCAKSAA